MPLYCNKHVFYLGLQTRNIKRSVFCAPQVLVFGRCPGSRSSGVPGARVGYMPQELALFGEFSIGQATG
jgi:hypothetical protein